MSSYGGKTQITMWGILLDSSQNPVTRMDVSEAAKDENALRDNVIIDSTGKNLVVGTASISGAPASDSGVSITDQTTSVANGFRASQLNLGTGSDGILITNGKTMGLGGSKGGSLVTVGNAEAAVTIAVGSSNSIDGGTTAGTLQIGDASSTASKPAYTLKGSTIQVNADGEMNIVSGTLSVQNVYDTGTVSIAAGTGLTADIITVGQENNSSSQKGSFTSEGNVSSQNFIIQGGASASLNGGTLSGSADMSAAYVKDTGSVLNANNVTFNGGEVAADTGGTIHLTGGSITTPSGSGLYLSSEGGTITTNGTAINTGVSASDGALVTLTNSSIHGDGIDVQGSGSLLTVDGGSNSVGYMNLGDSSETDIKGGNTTDIASALTVKGGADLTVEGTNTSYTVEGTAHISDGKINITDGGKLVFASGSKLYADEAVQTNSSNAIMTAAVLTSGLSAASDASGSSKGVIHVSTGSSLVFASGSSAYTEAGSDNAVKTIADADAGATVSIDKAAKLYVDNVKTDGSSYDVSSVLTGEGAQGVGWNEIYGDTRLIKGTEESTGLYTFSNQDIGTALPSVCIPHAATQAYLSGSGAAYDFISKALDAKETKTDQAAADSINNAAALTDLGGVSYGTYSFAEDLSGVINDHRSEESHVWADYIRRDLKADGLKAGNLSADYDLSYNGVAVGADFKNTAHHCLGVALAYADGDVHTDGEFASTKNKSHYYGADLYDTTRFGSWIFKGDLGYVWSHNDLTQYNAGTRITGSPHADALMVGIRAEKPIHTGSSTWTPYAGIRYLSLHTDTYTDSLGFRHDTDNAGIWNIPVGVSFRHDFRSGKWTYGPQAAIGGLLAFGDTSANETVSYGSGQDTFGVDVTKNSFIGNVGFYAQKDVLSCGIFYGFQKGSDIRSHQWTVSCSMKF